MIAAAARLRSIRQPSDRALLCAAAHGGGEANLQKRGLAAARRAHDGQQASALNSAAHPMQNPPASCAVAVPRNVAEAQTRPSHLARMAAAVQTRRPFKNLGVPLSNSRPSRTVDLDLEILDGLGMQCVPQPEKKLETQVVTGSSARDRLAGGTRRQVKGWTPHSWRIWTGRSPASWTATRFSRTRSCASARRYALPCSPPRAKYVPAASDPSCAHLALRRTATAGHMPRADCSAVE